MGLARELLELDGGEDVDMVAGGGGGSVTELEEDEGKG